MSMNELISLVPEATGHESLETAAAAEAPAHGAISGPESLRERLAELHIDLQLLAHSTSEGRASRARELQAKVGSLADCPAFPPESGLARQSGALAAFLSALCDRPEDITDSSLRTVSSAADVLDAMSRSYEAAPEQRSPTYTAALFEVNSAVSGTLTAALARAGFEVKSFSSALGILKHLESNPVDIVVLNVPVPVPRGFDVSQRIPQLPLHEETPMLMTLSTSAPGAERLSTTEMVLKALTLVHKRRWAASEVPEIPSIASLSSAETLLAAEEPALDAPDPDAEQAADMPISGIVNPGTGPSLLDMPEVDFRLSEPSESGEQPRDDLALALCEETEKRRRVEIELQESLATHAQLRMEAEMLAGERAQMACNEQAGRLAELERQLAAERDANEELTRRLATLEPSGAPPDTAEPRLAQAGEHIHALEQRLSELGEELEASKLAGERQAALEAELANARQAAQQAAARSDSRVEALEDRLFLATQELERTQARLEQAGTTGNRTGSVESAHKAPAPVPETVAALAHATAELEKERGMRQRSEERAGALATQLRQLHDEMGMQLDAERESRTRISELEEDLQTLSGEVARLTADLRNETAGRERAEKDLQAAEALASQLDSNLGLLEEARMNFEQLRQELENRLRSTQTSLASAEARLRDETLERRRLDGKLQEESAERRRLEEALAASQTSLEKQQEDNRFELSKLRASLRLDEVERKRREQDLACSQRASAKSARAEAASVDGLRRQLRSPIEELRQSACALLRNELPEEQKKLVEKVLENALLMQTSVQAGPVEPAGGA